VILDGKEKEMKLPFVLEQRKNDDLTLLFQSTGYHIQVLFDLVGEDVNLLWGRSDPYRGKLLGQNPSVKIIS
jgi:hypothetical protein